MSALHSCRCQIAYYESAFSDHCAVKVYVGKLPFGFVSVSGCVMTPVPTFPDGVEIVIDGVEIAPESFTPMIVPVTSIEPPTKSDDFITPSMEVVAMFPFMFNVEELS